MRYFLLILTLLTGTFAFAQKTKTVSATYTYYAPETMSIEEAKRTALERAKIQAIADEFGTIVSQSTSTVVTNTNGCSDTQFFSLGGSDVKGEWIETIGEPEYNVLYDKGMLMVSVSLKGKIREMKSIQIPLIAKVLRNGVGSQYEDDTFKSGDDMYLSFQSPVNGSLLVYLIDYSSDFAYCLLPYGKSQDKSQFIEGNREYVFFSDSYADESNKNVVDRYTLECENSSGTDYNEIVIMFSPEELIKTTSQKLSPDRPRQTDRKSFDEWCAKLKKTSTEVQIINKPIKIKL